MTVSVTELPPLPLTVPVSDTVGVPLAPGVVASPCTSTPPLVMSPWTLPPPTDPVALTGALPTPWGLAVKPCVTMPTKPVMKPCSSAFTITRWTNCERVIVGAAPDSTTWIAVVIGDAAALAAP